jgi:hypothetical protein
MSRTAAATIVTALAAALAAGACTDTYEYEPATAGETEGERQPRAKTSSQFLRGLYADVLSRTPETFEFVLRLNGAEILRFPLDEEAQLTTVLDGLGDSLPMRNLITKGLLHSTEVSIPTKTSIADPRVYIREQFRRFLGREPNAYELEQFAGEWAKDAAVGPRTIIRAIVGSREYQSQ